jgi:hypothetical protein
MAILIDGLIRSIETILDQQKIDAVKTGLDEGADALHRSRFDDLALAREAFGGSEQGLRLGGHHDRAHQVIAETLSGVVADLRDFREGVLDAETRLRDIDGGSAQDLDRTQAALAELQDANAFLASDSKYDDARSRGGFDR